MKAPLKNITCSQVQDRIEAYMDGALPDDEAVALDIHITACAACARELELAGRIYTSLRELPEPEVPEHVTAAAFDRVRAEISASRRRRLQAWLDGIRVYRWRPILATAMVIVLVLLGAYLRRQPTTPGAVTAEELDRAERQARWAIAYIGEEFKLYL